MLRLSVTRSVSIWVPVPALGAGEVGHRPRAPCEFGRRLRGPSEFFILRGAQKNLPQGVKEAKAGTDGSNGTY